MQLRGRMARRPPKVKTANSGYAITVNSDPRDSIFDSQCILRLAILRNGMNSLQIIAPCGDIAIWSEAFGLPEHEVVLLVAGSNAPASMWPDGLVAELVKDGYRVIRYDHRDTGRSTTRPFDTKPYGIDDLATDALAVLDAHNVARAHVVALSMGGAIGQLLALDHAERLLSLTLMMTAALDVDFSTAYTRAMEGEVPSSGLPGPNPDVVQQLSAMFASGNSEEEEIARRVEVWRTLNGALLPFDAEDFADRERKAIEHAGTFVPPVAHAHAKPIPIGRGSELRHITVPTLVIQEAVRTRSTRRLMARISLTLFPRHNLSKSPNWDMRSPTMFWHHLPTC